MANRFKGEASVTIDGKVWTLRMDFNAMCAFEEATGKAAMATLEGFEGGDYTMSDLRAIVHAMLLRHHPDATPQDAGDILSEDSEVLMRVLSHAMPDAGDREPGNGKRKNAA